MCYPHPLLLKKKKEEERRRKKKRERERVGSSSRPAVHGLSGEHVAYCRHRQEDVGIISTRQPEESLLHLLLGRGSRAYEDV